VSEAEPQPCHLQVVRTARYYQLGPTDGGVQELWFVLHGYGQLASYFIKHFQPLENGKRRIVAPEALSRFYLDGVSGRVGASWMTREDRLAEIDDYVRYLDAVYQAVTVPSGQTQPPLTVLGFSQGTATACRWLDRSRVPCERLILWAGRIPPDLDLERADSPFRKMRVTLVIGSTDEFATPQVLAEEETRLRAFGIAYELRRFQGGHEMHRPTLLRLVSEAPQRAE